MAGLSDQYELNVLDAILGPGFSKDATVYLALFNVSPGDASFGTEVSGSGYARVAIANNATNFPAAASGQKSNGVRVDFPTATGAWTTANAWALLNSLAGTAATNVITYGNLASAKTVASGETPGFPAASLVVSAD